MLRRAALLLLLVPGAAAAQPPKPARPPADLAAIPRDGFAVVTVKVSAAWELPALKPVRDWAAGQAPGTFDPILGVGPADLDRVTLYWPTADLLAADSPLVVTTTHKPYDPARVVRSLAGPRADTPARAGLEGSVLTRPRGQWVAFADDTTLVWNTGPDRPGTADPPAALIGQLVGRKAAGPLAPALAAAGDYPLVAGLDVAALKRPLAELGVGFPGYEALLKATTATLTADVADGGKVVVTLTVQFPDAAAAERAAPVVGERLADLAKLVGQAADRFAKTKGSETGAELFGWLLDGLKDAKVEANGAAVVATASGPLEPFLGRFVATFPKTPIIYPALNPAETNLRDILIALHNYESTYGFMPGDVGPDGKTPWSWRVQILPYLEHDALYRQLDLTRPWDDPKNKAILERAAMPKAFEVPGRPAPKGQTYFRSFSSPKDAPAGGRAWLTTGAIGPKSLQVQDGTSTTFAVVEAGEAVPWYAPDTLAYDPEKPVPPLGAKDAKTFLAGMADASVRAVRRDTAEKTLRALVTRDGGEEIEPPK